MAPIRVGIVGLSSKPGTWGNLAHLPRLASSPNFEIVALCNSSLASTQEAIKAHNLPSTTKAYDSPETLAADPDVDLFVVSTRVDTHYDIAKVALEAGKNIYVEWPLAATTKEAEVLVALAKEKKVKTIIGFQGRVSPSVLKVKEIIDSGRLGNIHSVNIEAVIGVWQNNAAGNRYHYFMDRKVGGNLLTIYGGHIIDSVLSALGELKAGYTPVAANLRPRMHIQQEDGSLSEEMYDKDTPDQILLQGRLERNPPAVLSLHIRAGGRFKDSPGATWRIYGDKGELVMTFASAGPQIGAMTSMKINDLIGGEVEDISIDEGGSEWTDLPTPGQNIGRLYEAYAAGRPYGDFELALKRHHLVDEFYASGM